MYGGGGTSRPSVPAGPLPYLRHADGGGRRQGQVQRAAAQFPDGRHRRLTGLAAAGAAGPEQHLVRVLPETGTQDTRLTPADGRLQLRPTTPRK